jgi:ABC-type hemin transport system ATPase subunit
MHELELAYITADEILCIDADGGICMSGKPDEVFSDSRLSSLYGLEEGRLSALYADFLGGLGSDG